ncbi:MAG TPA: hypothetical protein VFS43_26960 [Polyangiaceae bacterium]|nr:hypothetical protein [Polyangiaceae bacterium]
MVDRAPASPQRHRFLCPRCRSALTPWLRELALREALSARDATWLLPGGFFAHRDAALFGDDVPTPAEAYPWLLAPLGERWLKAHPDLGRTTGCCGLSYRDEGRPNLICPRGHEVGLSYRECRGPHWYALSDEAERQSENDPRPLVDPGPKLARARSLAARPLPALAPFAGGAHEVRHDEPEGWLGALWLEAPSVECAGGEGAPSFVVRAKGLPADRALVLRAPWPQIVRLLCLDEPPWGSPDLPLVWNDAAAPTVEISRHDELILLTTSAGEPSGGVALVFDANEWAGAWARAAQAP